MKALFTFASCALVTGCFEGRNLTLAAPCSATKQCMPGLACLQNKRGVLDDDQTEDGLPRIASLRGDGSADDRIAAGFDIKGQNLESTSAVALLDRAGARLGALSLASASAGSVSVQIPATVVDAITASATGNFTVQVTTAAGAARQDVQILRGETGAAGDAGLAGLKGDKGDAGDPLSQSALDTLDGRYVKMSPFATRQYRASPSEFIALAGTAGVPAESDDARVISSGAKLRVILHLPDSALFWTRSGLAPYALTFDNQSNDSLSFSGCSIEYQPSSTL